PLPKGEGRGEGEAGAGSTSPAPQSAPHTWDLAADVSPDVLSANPHADGFGNAGVWYFYTEPDNGGSGAAPAIPAGSLLARWQSEPSAKAKEKLAQELEKLVTSDPPHADEGPDAKLYQQLSSLGGPLFSSLLSERKTSLQKPASPAVEAG